MSKKTGIIAAVLALVVVAVGVGSYCLDGDDLLGAMRKKARYTRPTSTSRTIAASPKVYKEKRQDYRRAASGAGIYSGNIPEPVQEHGSVSVSLNSSALKGFLNPASSQEIFKFDVTVSGEESVVLKTMQLKCNNTNPNFDIEGGYFKIYAEGMAVAAGTANDNWCVSGLETELDYEIGAGQTKMIEVKYNTLGLNVHPYASDAYIFELQELEVEYLESGDKQMAEELPLNGKLLEYY